jgi:cellobiose-specific phosphotransferase system component IIB
MKEFKQLRGNRVFLEIPPRKETVIELTPELEAQLVKEEMEKYTKLTVYSVGDLIQDIKEGDVVLVDPQVLQKSPIVKLSDEKSVIMVNTFDIALIW